MAILPGVSEQDEQVLQELQRFMDSNMNIAAPPVPAPPTVEADSVVLDDAMLNTAQQVARATWYSSWVGATAIVVMPFLLLAAGVIGGQATLQVYGMGGILFLFICGWPFLGLPWLALFLGHRSRVKGILNAIAQQRAWSITGPVEQTGAKTIVVAGSLFTTVQRVRIPTWAKTASCTVVFADSSTGPAFGPGGAVNRGTVISITGPDGRQIYPPTGAVPALFKVPALIASILFSIAFTAACNAQSQAYGDAATRLRDIEASAQCTKANKPGDDCWQWVPGTVARKQGYTIMGASPQPVNSSCTVMLRWTGGQQEGDIRVDGTDCTKQLPMTTTPAKIQLVKNFAIQVTVGDTTYQTDRWTPVGDTVYTLELILRVATYVWLAWPFIHIAAAVIYRVSFRSAPQASTPLPPAPALGSAT